MGDDGGGSAQAGEAAGGGAAFTVPDMSCGHCAGVIRQALEAGLPGVEVSIDLRTQAVTVGGDAGRAEATIRGAGYEPMRRTG